MARPARQRPPIWFWAIVLLALLWALTGLMAYYGSQAMADQAAHRMSEYDQRLQASIPVWIDWVYGAAVWLSMLGALSLLFRHRFATAFFAASLLAVLVQFGWAFLATDILAVKGARVTLPLPVFIIAIAAVETWFSRFATRRGWLR